MISSSATECIPPPASPARQRYLQRLTTRCIKPAARDYYVRWAEAWTKALGHRSQERTQAFFDALGRTAHLADWQKPRGPEGFWTQRSAARRVRRRAAPPSQFRQAVDAVRMLADEILTIPWAAVYDWQGLADQARSLEPDHRTLGRENIQVCAVIPLQPEGDPGPLPDTATEIARVVDALRRAIRLAGLV